MVLITKTIDLSTIKYGGGAQVNSKDPIRSLLITNLSAANITLFLGENIGQTTDQMTIPASTALDFDMFELGDEDIHQIIFMSGPATGTVLIAYKASPDGPKVIIAGRQAPRGYISA
jgi:hypothetical protein